MKDAAKLVHTMIGKNEHESWIVRCGLLCVRFIPKSNELNYLLVPSSRLEILASV